MKRASKDNTGIPLLLRIILLLAVSEDDFDQYCGDLEEAYIQCRKTKGKFAAYIFLVKQLLSSIPGIIYSNIYWGGTMFRNYFKIALRNFNRSKLFSVVNISGLSLGMALVLYILLFVKFHLSFDKFHKDVDRIYKVGIMTKSDRGTEWAGSNMSPVGETIKNNFPQVEESARVVNVFEPAIKYSDRMIKGHSGIYAESSFFRIMNFPIIAGDTKTPLERKNTVIFTKTLASKIFDKVSPIGKIVRINNEEMEVTAVIEDYPPDTDFDLDLYVSWKNAEDWQWMGWNLLSRATITYVKLKDGIDPKQFEKMISNIPAEHCSEEMKQKNMEAKLFLFPFKDNHLYTWENGYREGRKALSYVYILSGVGILILLIACVNFMNLSTARASLRAREVGVRKVIGANRRQLVKQFMGESFLSVIISAALGLVLLFLFTPYFNELTDIKILFENIWSSDSVLGLCAIVILTGLISGLYPAFYLSRYSPAVVLKGETSGTAKGVTLRKILVITQFTITVILMLVTIVMFKQVGFMKDHYLGFDKEQKLIIALTDWEMITDNFESAKNEFLSNSSLTKASAASGIPGVFVNNLYIESEIHGVRSSNGPRCLRCDYDFLKLLDVNLLAGRFFEKERVSNPDESGLVINESASKMFGFKSPDEAVGSTVYIGGDTSTEIIGVTKDFHWVGLQTEIEPLVMRYVPELFKYITLQLNTENISETMEFIEDKYKELFPGQVFDYMFVDENFDKLYREEDRLVGLFTTVTLLGIGIACLGLFGLAAFMVDRKRKEIGVRRVLGATVRNIVIMITKEYAGWVIIANLIGWPIGYYVMQKWLEDFAYRTSIGLSIFFIALLIGLGIALCTVLVQAIRAALSNPVEALKYE